jgi:hypothetical protein
MSTVATRPSSMEGIVAFIGEDGTTYYGPYQGSKLVYFNPQPCMMQYAEYPPMPIGNWAWVPAPVFDCFPHAPMGFQQEIVDYSQDPIDVQENVYDFPFAFAPADAPAEALAEAHADAPAEAHADAHADAPTDAHAEALADALAEAHADAPAEAHADAHAEALADAPTPLPEPSVEFLRDAPDFAEFYSIMKQAVENPEDIIQVDRAVLLRRVMNQCDLTGTNLGHHYPILANFFRTNTWCARPRRGTRGSGGVMYRTNNLKDNWSRPFVDPGMLRQFAAFRTFLGY